MDGITEQAEQLKVEDKKEVEEVEKPKSQQKV